jgi:shikimate dehydrogenase
MLSFPDGETRVHLILGDPVAQTKSPSGLTAEFRRRGVNAICIPLHVTPVHFDAVMAAVRTVRNVDGMVITVPHKLAALRHCDEVSKRARLLGAANVLRRTAAGRWQGDMTDGAATVAALERAGATLAGRRALVLGAGGAGSAVALALLEGGIAALTLADVAHTRSAGVVARLAGPTATGRAGGAALAAGAPDPDGCDIVVNATPVGMAVNDPLPLDAARLKSSAVVADLVTRPEMTKLLLAARKRGCTVVTGADMFAHGAGMMADFLLTPPGDPALEVAAVPKSR